MPQPTSQQEKVIRHTNGPLLVIAGPGSGKTSTLVGRIAHLVNKKGVPPEALLVATFTDKAARELITRISIELTRAGRRFNVNEMLVGTFHSICQRLLEQHRAHTRLKRNWKVIDQFSQAYRIFQKLKEFEKLATVADITGDQTRHFWKKAQLIMGYVNLISEEALDVAKLSRSRAPQLQGLAQWYNLYQKMQEEENYIDFAGLQRETLRLLEEYPQDILAPLNAKISHVMIDEYQDTNSIQERLTLLWGGPQQNICVVGDDDQGLYRFRGATIRNIFEFPQNFADGACPVYKLTTNFRSETPIIDFYGHWMDNCDWSGPAGQSFRYHKKINAPVEKRKKATPPALAKAGAIGQEVWHNEVLAFLKHLKQKGLSDWNQVAFLFKSVGGDKARGLADFLETQGIPVYAPRSGMFFDRQEIRLMIGAVLALFPIRVDRLSNPDAGTGYRPPIWGYYDACVDEFMTEVRLAANSDLRKWLAATVRHIESLTQASDLSFSGLFYELLQFPLFSRFLGVRQGLLDERPARNLGIFSGILNQFEFLHHVFVIDPKYLDYNLKSLLKYYLPYVMDGGITEFEDDLEHIPRGCISFMTIHQSKGLEFPVTVVGSLSSTPRKQNDPLKSLLLDRYAAKSPFEPEDRTKTFDFYRLFYTAFSRAQSLLVLTAPEKRSGPGAHDPNSYFQSIYDGLPSWRKIKINPKIFPLVRQADLKREYAFTSHILFYEACPRQYQFFKNWSFAPVRQSPILFGALVHQTIEDIHKAVLTGQVNRVKPDQIEDWFYDNYRNLSQSERVYLAPRIQQTALTQVLRYVERRNGDWSNLREAEVEVALVKDDYILKGQIDLIEGLDNTVEIMDFKATKKPDLKKESEVLERYRRQLEIYAHVIEERYGLSVSRLNLYYTGEEDGSPMVSFKKEAKHIDKTIAEVENVVHNIEASRFAPPATRPKTCVDCDLRHYCNRYA
jgi:DNA helicase-2/ATP-dependent DNA helicase PcrA